MPAPRVDLHAHLGGIGTDGSGITVSPRFRGGLVFRALWRVLEIAPRDREHADRLYVETLARLVRESKAYDHAVALAMDGVWTDGQLDRTRSPLVVPNDWARDASRAHPELLYGASVSPLRPDALDELERVAADGAALVKWLPNVMHVDPAAPAHVPFFRKLAALGLPLLTHCGAELTLPGGSTSWGDPRRLEPALGEGVTVVAAHCGTLCWTREHGRWTSGRALLACLMARHPNLHADLSALVTPLRGWELRRVLDDETLSRRVLDATDFPVPHLVWTQLGRVSVGELVRLRRIRNFFDRDRALKVAAGMTETVTRRAFSVLRLGERGILPRMDAPTTGCV